MRHEKHYVQHISNKCKKHAHTHIYIYIYTIVHIHVSQCDMNIVALRKIKLIVAASPWSSTPNVANFIQSG